MSENFFEDNRNADAVDVLESHVEQPMTGEAPMDADTPINSKEALVDYSEIARQAAAFLARLQNAACDNEGDGDKRIHDESSDEYNACSEELYECEDDRYDEDDENRNDYENDEDDDDCNYENEDDDEDSEDDDMFRAALPSGPIGKRVILRSDYRSNRAYGDAVVESIRLLLSRDGIRITPRRIRDQVVVFAFRQSVFGVNVDSRVICDYDICDYRIDFCFNVPYNKNRMPLLDHYSQEKNFPLRYGSLIVDHSDGEQRIEYSSCFYGAFSEQTFKRYWQALGQTLQAYAFDFNYVATSKNLNPALRRTVRNMISGLATDLPDKVKEENQEMFDKAVEALGGKLSSRDLKLLNYIVGHQK